MIQSIQNLYRERIDWARRDRVVLEDPVESISLNQAIALVERYRSALRDWPEGEPVLILYPRSARSILIEYAAMLEGRPFAPIDERFPAERVRYAVECLGACLVVAQGSLAPLAKLAGMPVLVLADSPGDAIPADIAAQARLGEPRTSQPENPVYIMFTSGSTGRPKAVPVLWRSIPDLLYWVEREAPIGPTDTIGLTAELGFDLCIPDIFLFPLDGRRMVVLPREILPFPDALLARLEGHRIDSIVAVPSLLSRLAMRAKTADRGEARLSRVVSIGEALHAETLSNLREVFPRAAIHNMYGPTEACFCCTGYRCGASAVEPGEIPLGAARDGAKVEILKADGSAAGEGEEGEIIISGDCLAGDYIGAPEASAKAYFILADGSRAYHSGDLAVWRGGEMFFRGRVDSQVKFNGYRIELEEIERAVSALGGVAKAVAVPLAAAGFIVCLYEGSRDIDRHEGVDSLSRELPKYMIPRRFVRMAALPLTPNGKVDRRQANAAAALAQERPQG